MVVEAHKLSEAQPKSIPKLARCAESVFIGCTELVALHYIFLPRREIIKGSNVFLIIKMMMTLKNLIGRIHHCLKKKENTNIFHNLEV